MQCNHMCLCHVRHRIIRHRDTLNQGVFCLNCKPLFYIWEEEEKSRNQEKE